MAKIVKILANAVLTEINPKIWQTRRISIVVGFKEYLVSLLLEINKIHFGLQSKITYRICIRVSRLIG